MNLFEKISNIIERMGQWLIENKQCTTIMIFALLIIGFVLIFIPVFMKANNYIKKKAIQTKREFITHEKKRYIQDYLDCKLTRWMDDTFKYSRVFNTKLGKYAKTSVGFLVLNIIMSGLVMIIMAAATSSIVTALITFVCWFTFTYIILFLFRVKNKIAVGNELINFLNLLGNYSTANTEIFSTLNQIAGQVKDPLSTCLEECVAESQDPNKSKTEALRNLGNKIEDEKFKEIIKNLEIAQNNSGSFGQIVSINRHSILEYTHGKKLKSGIAKENFISFSIILIAIVCILAFMGQFLSVNVFKMLVTTTVGIIVLLISIIITIVFTLSVISSSR